MSSSSSSGGGGGGGGGGDGRGSLSSRLPPTRGSVGKPLNPQKRLLPATLRPDTVVSTPTATIQISDISIDGVATGQVVAFNGVGWSASYTRIIGDESGEMYIFDTGTSTYWKWQSISGVWTGTDTTSASLP